MRGALFTSAGGYRHHVAMNTWNSLGADPWGTQVTVAIGGSALEQVLKR